jgi:hypothetical protein
LEHQRIRPQARDVFRGIEAVQLVVELVGQEDRVQLRLLANLLFPVGLGEGSLGGIEEGVRVRHGDAVTREAEELAGNLDEPGVLHRVVQPAHVAEDGADAVARRRLAAQRLVAHPGRVRQLRVVVVAEDVVERLGSGGERVDVRVRINEGDGTKGGIEVVR